VLNTYVQWLRAVGRCPEVIEEAERALRTDPNRMRVMTGLYSALASCKQFAGHSDEALALQQKRIGSTRSAHGNTVATRTWAPTRSGLAGTMTPFGISESRSRSIQTLVAARIGATGSSRRHMR
jgi:hypothetical protein